MSRMEKAPEPSMEDILASIRKIIAEEPAGAQASGASAPGATAAKSSTAQHAQVSSPAQQAPASQHSASPSQPAAAKAATPAPRRPASQATVDDVLSLADDVPTVRSPAAAPRPQIPAAQSSAGTKPAGAEQSLDWARPKPAQPAPQQPRVPSAPAQSLPAPFFAADAAKAAPSKPDSAAATPVAQNGLSDLGSFVPGRFDDKATAASPSRPDASPLAGLLNGLGKLGQPLPASQQPTQHANGVVAPRQGSGTDLNGAAAHAAAVVKSPEKKPEPAPLKSQVVAEAAKSDAMPAAKALSPLLDAPTQPQAPAPVKPAAAAEPQKPPLAASNAVAKVDTPNSALPATVKAPVTEKAVAAEPLVSAPVLLGTPLPAPAVVAPKPLVPASAAASTMPAVMNSVEERVVELLRPMIREWLDNNMPRMVEKALSNELAASAKPKGPASRN